jgi:hypothetical protein
MKVIALFMVVCMSLVSVFTGTVQAMQYGKEPRCCIHAGMTSPCKSHKNEKEMGMCLTRLCCNVPGFTINKAIEIEPEAHFELKNGLVKLEHEGTIDFSFPFWHPPKGLL